MKPCPYELNQPKAGAIAIVGTAPDAYASRAGRPFVGHLGRILEDAMAEAGLRRASVNLLHVSRQRPPKDLFVALKRDVIASEIAELRATLRRLKPSVIVTLGVEAAHAVIPDWPDARSADGLIHRGTIKSATDLENRRGYVFDSPFGPVIPSKHPSEINLTWSPWRTLLSFDLQRAVEVSKHGLVRPTREVEIIRSPGDATRALGALRRHRILASDIETWGDSTLACVGFAGSGGKAYVFPAEYLDRASELLGDPKLTTVWANGIYDLFVLKHRYGVKIANRIEDAQVMWHATYPELAGAKEDRRKHRFTRKSLSFLASLSTFDEWWKGDYQTRDEFFIYNGKDCLITRDVFDFTTREMQRVGAEATYEHERDLIWPCVDMLQRGLRVDERLRQERVAALEADLASASARATEMLVPFLEERREELEAAGVLHLFEETEPTCECCRHASKKQMACWSCVGFTQAPSKRDLMRVFGRFDGTKAEMEARFLPTCRVCGGKERKTFMTVNLNSDAQCKALLYDVLKMPKRFGRNSKGDSVLKSDEATLKNLLATITDDAEGEA